MKTRQNSKIYEIGTCFFCLKCMYCAKNACNCDKSVKPNTKNRTNVVKFFRSCIHSLDKKDNEFYTGKVLDSVEKVGYKVDLNKPFHYTICSSCNGKLYREKQKLMIPKKINQESSDTSSLPTSNPSSIPTTPSTTFNDIPISETEELSLLDSSDIFNSSATPLPTSLSPSPTPTSPLSKEQFKFKLQIKNTNDISPQPSSLIIMEEKPFDLFEFKEKIHESLNEKYGLMNYGDFKMIYKTENSNGAGNWLNNDDEFNEFLNYHENLKKTTRMILVVVNVQSKRKVS